MDKEYLIGVDLGGTKILTAVVHCSNRIIAKVKADTEANFGADHVIKKINESIYKAMELSNISQNQVAGIGICSPGPLSVSEGTVLYVATLGWNNVPIRRLIHDEFKIPVFLENDCNAAAFAELCLGAGRGYKDIVYVTISTGIGSGIIINKEIYHGKHDAAGEFGHICVEENGRKCSCGNLGCLQAYASGTSIAEIYMENYGGVSNVDCQQVEKAAYNGDVQALKIWRQAGEKLGQGVSIMLMLLDPELIIIGGGVSKAWSLFYGHMVNEIKKHTYKMISDDLSIVPAQLGEDAGVLGAAIIALKNA